MIIINEVNATGTTLEKDFVAVNMSGTKYIINENEKITIPEEFQYNVHGHMSNSGVIEVLGILNIL